MGGRGSSSASGGFEGVRAAARNQLKALAERTIGAESYRGKVMHETARFAATFIGTNKASRLLNDSNLDEVYNNAKKLGALNMLESAVDDARSGSNRWSVVSFSESADNAPLQARLLAAYDDLVSSGFTHNEIASATRFYDEFWRVENAKRS